MENIQQQLTLLFMSDFLNNALNAADCTASAVATPVSLLHIQTGRTWKRRTAHVDCGSNVTNYVLTLSVSITFSDFPGLHDSHGLQQLKFSLYGCQPTAQSANVGGRTRDKTSDDNRFLAQSRALGKLDQKRHTAWNTPSLLDYLAKLTLPYIILIQTSFKFVCCI